MSAVDLKICARIWWHALFLTSLLVRASNCFAIQGNVVTTPGVTAFQLAQNLFGARTVLVDPNSGDALVLTRGGTTKVALVRVIPGGDTATTYPLLNTGIALTHGMVISAGFLYASTDTTVYRWQYVSGSTTPINAGAFQVVVRNLNADGRGGAPQGHTTRTLAIDSSSRLYVSVGSLSNLDTDSFRARIRRFDLRLPIPAGGWDFIDPANVFADGLRNQVALALDLRGRLWGCETGIDEIARNDLGLGRIVDNNPAEELHLFDGPQGQFFGYPYCFSSYRLGSFPACTQFAVNPTSVRTDAWCRNPANNRVPELCMPAHTSPLGLTFFNGQGCNLPGGFPCAWTGDAFIAMHGSWNRVVPDGFQVIHVPMNPATGRPAGGFTTLASMRNFATACLGSLSAGCWRPVGVAFLRDGRLIVTSDATNEATLLTYSSGGPRPITNPPTPQQVPAPATTPSPTPAGCPALPATAGTRVLAVNAGGGALCGFSAAATAAVTGGFDFQYAGAASNVYKSVRLGGDFTYALPVAGGRLYTVRLLLQEDYWTTPGARVFNVFVGHTRPTTTPGLLNVDIVAMAGGRGVGISRTLDYTVPAGFGTLYVRFAYVRDLATVSALEVFQR